MPELNGRRGAGQDERILFQYRDFVDFVADRACTRLTICCKRCEQEPRWRCNDALTPSRRRGGGGTVVAGGIPGVAGVDVVNRDVTDYADVVRYKQMVDEATAQIETLSRNLRERDKDVRRLVDDVRARQRLINRRQNENEIMRVSSIGTSQLLLLHQVWFFSNPRLSWFYFSLSYRKQTLSQQIEQGAA